MTRSRRLDPLLKVAEERERAAARALAESLARHRAAEERLGMLQGYRAEYQARSLSRATGGMTAAGFLAYQAFLERLGQAIGQQEQLVTAARDQVEHDRKLWRDQAGRAQSLGKARAHLRREEHGVELAREQRELDERAALSRPGPTES